MAKIKFPEWLQDRIVKEKWAKKLEGVLVEQRIALNPITHRNEVKYFKRTYSLKIPKISRYRFWFMNYQLFKYGYNGETKQWRHIGLVPNLVNFGIPAKPNMLLWLSLRHPLMVDLDFKISKKETPLTNEKAFKLLKSGKAYPYAMTFRQTTEGIETSIRL